MLANEILRALQSLKFKSKFSGIFAADTVPRNLKSDHFIIVNTDISTGHGIHWYAIVRLGKVIECFDSLGIKEDQKNFICTHFNFPGIRYISFNTTQVQPLSSILCGQFVLYFLYERYHNLDLDFDDLLNSIFDNNLQKNDDTVSNFISLLRKEWHE